MDTDEAFQGDLLLLASVMAIGYLGHLSSETFSDCLSNLLGYFHDLIAIPAVRMVLISIISTAFILGLFLMAFHVPLFWYQLLFCCDADEESVSFEAKFLSEQQLLDLSWSVYNEKLNKKPHAWRMPLPAPTAEEINALTDPGMQNQGNIGEAVAWRPPLAEITEDGVDVLEDFTIIATAQPDSLATNAAASTTPLQPPVTIETLPSLVVEDPAPSVTHLPDRKQSTSIACSTPHEIGGKVEGTEYENGKIAGIEYEDGKAEGTENEDEGEDEDEVKQSGDNERVVDHLEFHSLADIYQELFGQNRLHAGHLIWHAANIGNLEAEQPLDDSAFDALVENTHQQFQRGDKSVHELIMEAYVLARRDSQGSDTVWDVYDRGNISFDEASRLADLFVDPQAHYEVGFPLGTSQPVDERDTESRTHEDRRILLSGHEHDGIDQSEGGHEDSTVDPEDSDIGFDGLVDREEINDLPTLLKKYNEGAFLDEDAIRHACQMGNSHREAGRLEEAELDLVFEGIQAMMEEGWSMPDLIEQAYSSARTDGSDVLGDSHHSSSDVGEDSNHTPNPGGHGGEEEDTDDETENYFQTVPQDIEDIPTLWARYRNAPGSAHKKGVVLRACEIGNRDRGDSYLDEHDLEYLFEKIYPVLKGQDRPLLSQINRAYESVRYHGLTPPKDLPGVSFPPESDMEGESPTSTLNCCVLMFCARVEKMELESGLRLIHLHDQMAELWHENLPLLRMECHANFVAEVENEDGSWRELAVQKSWTKEELLEGDLWRPGWESYVYPAGFFEGG